MAPSRCAALCHVIDNTLRIMKVSKAWLIGVLEWSKQRNRSRSLVKANPSNQAAKELSAVQEERKTPSTWRNIAEVLLIPFWIVAGVLILGAMVVAQAIGFVIAMGLVVWMGWLVARDYVRALRSDWRSTLRWTGAMILTAAGFILIALIIGVGSSGKPRECIEPRSYSTTSC